MHVQKAYPEHEKEVQAAVDLIFQQGMTIKLLEEALEQGSNKDRTRSEQGCSNKVVEQGYGQSANKVARTRRTRI